MSCFKIFQFHALTNQHIDMKYNAAAILNYKQNGNIYVRPPIVKCKYSKYDSWCKFEKKTAVFHARNQHLKYT